MYITEYNAVMTDDEALSFAAGTGYLLARLGSLSERSWAAMLRQHNLTPHQHAVLLALRERGPLAQQTLASLMAIDPRNLGPILDALDEAGTINRRTDLSDRRRRVIALTRHGRNQANALAADAARIERDFLTGLDSSDQAELNRLLRALHRALTNPA